MGLKQVILAGMSLLTGCSGAASQTPIAWELPAQFEVYSPQSPECGRAVKALARKGDAAVYYRLGNIAFGGVTRSPGFFARDAGYVTRHYAVLLGSKGERVETLPNPALYDQFLAAVQSDRASLPTDVVVSTFLLLGLGSYNLISKKMIDEMPPDESRGLFAPKIRIEDGSPLILEFCARLQSNMTRPVATSCTLACVPHAPILACKDIEDAQP